MTLSASIAIRPSRRLERLATVLPIGGVIVATITVAWSGPQCFPMLALSATALCVAAFGASIRRRGTSVTLTVSQHAQIDVQPSSFDGSWRLSESTMFWPSFAMLALRPFDPSVRASVVRVPVFLDELEPSDRRSLSRFLIWSMQGPTSGSSPPTQS